ncbi:hypothetical protein V1504DRAFT_433457 [Lipomyces starkeyi]
MAASAFDSDRDLRTAWFIDSGATAHICCQAELFEELDTSWKKALDGLGGGVRAEGIGTVKLKELASAVVEPVDLWHARLGHISMGQVVEYETYFSSADEADFFRRHTPTFHIYDYGQDMPILRHAANDELIQYRNIPADKKLPSPRQVMGQPKDGQLRSPTVASGIFSKGNTHVELAHVALIDGNPETLLTVLQEYPAIRSEVRRKLVAGRDAVSNRS